MTALYFVLMSGRGIRPWRHLQDYKYNFKLSLEDIVVFSYARFLGVLLAYLLGAGHRMMRCPCYPH